MSFALEMDEKIILSHSTPKTVNNQPDDTECNKNSNQSIIQHTNTLTIKTPKTPKVVIVSPVRTPKSILKKSKTTLVFDKEESPRSKRIKLEIPSNICTESEVRLSNNRSCEHYRTQTVSLNFWSTTH